MIIRFEQSRQGGSPEFTQVDELRKFLKETYYKESEETFFNWAVEDVVRVLKYIQSKFIRMPEFGLRFRTDVMKFELSLDEITYFGPIADTVNRTWTWSIGDGHKL